MARDFARQLRRTMTDTERRFWHHVRTRQIDGRKFRRQAPIGPYIVDFVCFEAGLIIELDGGQHASLVEADAARTAWLEAEGFRVMRFWNHQVFEELDCVLESVWLALQAVPPDCGEIGEGEK